nr:ribonuclease H-like domain-containing protein [Tanacetum cinerariifolium]
MNNLKPLQSRLSPSRMMSVDQECQDIRSNPFEDRDLDIGGDGRYNKSRLVANSSSQQLGVDFDETFSLVIKPDTIHTVLSRAVSRKWPIHQLDIKNAFLNKKYALQLLERANMVTCNPSRTPINTESKLGPEGVSVQDPTLYRSLAGGLQFPIYMQVYFRLLCILGDNILSWSAKQQHIISSSSAKAEYRGVANVVAETAWIGNLLCELHSHLSTATLVYCDNVSVVYMSANPVQHQRTKHNEIDIHFVCDMVTAGHVRILHVPSCFQYADIFTKGLSTALFEDFCSSLSICPPLAQTIGAY